jgi:hypothetical protein
MIFMKTSHTLAFCLGVIGIALILAESSTGSASRAGLAANHGDHSAPAETPPAPDDRPAVVDEGAATVDDAWYDSPLAGEDSEPAAIGPGPGTGSPGTGSTGTASPEAEYAPDTPPTADTQPPREQA